VFVAVELDGNSSIKNSIAIAEMPDIAASTPHSKIGSE
jgi:hypothetical protein